VEQIVNFCVQYNYSHNSNNVITPSTSTSGKGSAIINVQLINSRPVNSQAFGVRLNFLS